MAIKQKILGMNDYFNSTKGYKVIVNHLSMFEKDDSEMLNRLLTSEYTGSDTFSTIPTCDCGESTGAFRLHQVCRRCATEVTELRDRLDPILWLKVLEPTVKFLSPIYYIMLTKLLDKKIDYLYYLSNPKIKEEKELPVHIVGILNNVLGGVREYANTMAHIPKILEYLKFNAKYKETANQIMIEQLMWLYQTNADTMYSDHLPIINKRLFVVENTSKGKFINLTLADAMEVVNHWIKASEEVSLVTGEKAYKHANIHTATVLHKFGILYKKYFKIYLTSKTGIFRKHVWGARSHFTFRAVITSIPGPHCHDDIYVPWKIFITVFRPHIMNKLIKRGIKYRDATRILFKAASVVEPLMSEIVDELLREVPGGRGIPCLAHRNPSLLQGSSMRCYIRNVKYDITDSTTSISALIIKNCNGKGRF